MMNIFEKINQASLKFLEPLPKEGMYKTIVKEAEKLVGADCGTIILEQDDDLTRVYSDAEFLNNVKIRKNGQTRASLKRQTPTLFSATDLSNIHPNLIKQGIKDILHIPLSYKKKSIGVLALHFFHKVAISDADLKSLQLYGSLATLAIKKTQNYTETLEALETRDLFISIASHELRTPLTSLNGYIQLLEKRVDGQQTVEAKYIHELVHESERLTTLVKELLEVNRIKQGQLHFVFQECSINEIVQTAVERVKSHEFERIVTFDKNLSQMSDKIIGDPEKLTRVFVSILNNAYKFSLPNSHIGVSTRTKLKEIVISITDEGKGISGKDLPHIFEGFYKGSDNHQEGMGVGLLLAKHIIESHHGSISATSEEKKGTTVEVKLPVIK